MATKFTITPANGPAIEVTGNYKIESGGVLAVKPEQGNPVIYSPVGWLQVEVTEKSNRSNLLG